MKNEMSMYWFLLSILTIISVIALCLGLESHSINKKQLSILQDQVKINEYINDILLYQDDLNIKLSQKVIALNNGLVLADDGSLTELRCNNE